MVDALRRVHRLVTPDGSVVDVHPTATPASLWIGDQSLGLLDNGDAPERHAAAGMAVIAAINEGLFTAVETVDFVFHTFGDSVEELRDHVAERWRTTRIGSHLVSRARDCLESASTGTRPRVVEEVRLTVLRPA